MNTKEFKTLFEKKKIKISEKNHVRVVNDVFESYGLKLVKVDKSIRIGGVKKHEYSIFIHLLDIIEGYKIRKID